MKDNFKFVQSDIINECPVQHTHQFIGGKWRIGILWSLRNERRRFGQLKHDVLGISEKMLIQELKHLQALDVIKRRAFNEVPPKVEYRLSARGKTLIPLIEAVVTWGYTDIASSKTNAHIA